MWGGFFMPVCNHFDIFAIMQLKTSRLVLNEIISTDLDDIHTLNSIPEVDEFNTLGLPDSIETTKLLLDGWIDEQTAEPRTSYTFAMRSGADNQFIGMMAIRLDRPKYSKAEVWYKAYPAYWGKGYTSEALSALLKFGFDELGLHRIEAGCATENIASIKVLEKAGMTREGVCRKILPIRGEWVDNYMYAILDEDFK